MEKELENQILEWLQDIKDEAQEMRNKIDIPQIKSHILNIKHEAEKTIELIYKKIK